MSKTIVASIIAASVTAIVIGVSNANANSNEQNVQVVTQQQKDFIKNIDNQMGTNLYSMIDMPIAYAAMDMAYFACGDTDVQKKFIKAIGGTESDAQYASNQFETKYCVR